MRRTAVLAMLCVAFVVRVRANSTPCTFTLADPPLIDPTLLTPMGGIANTLSFDTLAVDMLQSDGVTIQAACTGGKMCLLAPWYERSDSCGALHRDCTPSSDGFCMVTDEFSQLGLILAMSTRSEAVTAFAEWVNTLQLIAASTTTNRLPAWLVRVRITGGISIIENATDDDASDATARAILALYIAANSTLHQANRLAYEAFADDLANRFAHLDFRDTANRFPVERFFLAAGKNAAANQISNVNPFSYAGYYGDAVLALLAAYRSTGETRYLRLVSDAITNYARAANFRGTFVVPPMRFSWTNPESGNTPARICRDSCLSSDRTTCQESDRFCDLARWDLDDAPRAVTLCKAAYFIKKASVPIDQAARDVVESYCDAWMLSAGVENGSPNYARSYFWDGTPYLGASSDYYQAGLGSSLNFYRCPADLRRRLQAAASMYDASAKVFGSETCVGIYTHAFFLVNFGSALGRDFRAFLAPLDTPAAVTVEPFSGTYRVAWAGVANATGYEVARSCNNEVFSSPTFVATNSWTDDVPRLGAGRYFYRVRAVQQPDGLRSTYSRAVATEPEYVGVVPRQTPITAADLETVRCASNRLRAAAGLPAKDYSALQSQPIRATDFTNLQADINEARRQLGVGDWNFETISAGQIVTARALQELREATYACPNQNLFNPVER